jgi:hypothetical protein
VKDRDYDALKSKLKAMSHKWADRMGLGWYRLNFEWVRDYNEEVRDRAGQCHSSWQYREATITFYLAKLIGFEDSVIEETVVHELAHCLASPLEDLSSDMAAQQTEYCTTLIAKAVKWAYDDGVKQGARKPRSRKAS